MGRAGQHRGKTVHGVSHRNDALDRQSFTPIRSDIAVPREPLREGHQKFTRCDDRVDVSNRAWRFVNSSGARYDVATEEADRSDHGCSAHRERGARLTYRDCRADDRITYGTYNGHTLAHDLDVSDWDFNSQF